MMEMVASTDEASTNEAPPAGYGVVGGYGSVGGYGYADNNGSGNGTGDWYGISSGHDGCPLFRKRVMTPDGWRVQMVPVC
jgi:hypothetical protein